MSDADAIRSDLAPTGTLRVGINMANMLLVTDREADGSPIGVAPDMARAIARRLDMPVTLHPYPMPGATADALSAGEVDMVLIANEAERAKTIAFSPAYCGIEATYLVPDGSPIASLADVDRPRIRIAVAGRAAYDLYLTRTLKNAELVRAAGLPAAVDLFVDEGLDALAGLRPALIDNAKAIPGARLLDGSYTTVLQSIGIVPGRQQGIDFVAEFCREACRSGMVADLLARHGVSDRLTVPSEGI